MLFVPPESPGFNPMELAFSKMKAHLRKAAPRTIPRLWDAIRDAIHAVAPGASPPPAQPGRKVVSKARCAIDTRKSSRKASTWNSTAPIVEHPPSFEYEEWVKRALVCCRHPPRGNTALGLACGRWHGLVRSTPGEGALDNRARPARRGASRSYSTA